MENKEEKMEKMERWTCYRTGDTPISFIGTRLGTASTYKPYGNNQNRYTDFSLYRTKGGKYVLSMQYYTAWQGESDEYTVIVSDNPTDLTKEFRDFLPEEVVEMFEEAGIDISSEID